MLDFKTKLVGKGREREKVEIIGPFRSYTARNKKFQKNSKKIQKIKKKIIVQFRSNTTRNKKFQKNSKKIQKVKKHHYGFFSSQKWLENAEKERK